jgi:deazaflavin-dependent oxidoreductase (nitroreductase family)
MSRLGLGPTQVLATTGRRSGQERTVPVTPIHVNGFEYVVAPYGQVSWVHNVRADPNVTLRKGRNIRHVRLVDVTLEAAEVVKAYWDKIPYVRSYMDVPGDASVEDFDSVAGRFPTFRVEEAV